jgi:hypothetical protein
MKSKKVWIYVIILFLLQAIVEYILHRKADSNDVSWQLSLIFDLGSGFVSIILLGLLGSILFSIIPFRQYSFIEKVKIFLPIVIIVLLGISVVFSIYMKVANTEEFRPIHKNQRAS